MAAWFSFRAEEDEDGDETCFWRYDSTWEEDDDEEEDKDGGEGQPKGAEAAAGEEPEDAEKSVLSSPRESRQAQVGAGRPSGAPQLARCRAGGTGAGGRALRAPVRAPPPAPVPDSSARLPLSVHLPGPAAFPTACILGPFSLLSRFTAGDWSR